MNKHDLSCEYFSRYIDAYKDGAIDVLRAIKDHRGGMTGEDWRDFSCDLLSNYRDNITDLFFRLFEWDDGEDGNGHIREDLKTGEKESKLSARVDLINKKIDILAKANNIIFTDNREGKP